MIESALLFDPTSLSLAGKIDAYQTIYSDWLNVEASLKFMDDPEWSDTLGERKEVEEAYEVIVNNLSKASQILSLDNIEMARDEGIISAEEALDLVSRKEYSDSKLESKKEQEQDWSLKL